MRILVVEDDEVLREAVAQGLKQSGHRVDQACTMCEADHLWRVQPYDAVLLDLRLPRHGDPDSPIGSGLSVMRAARYRGDRTPVLVLTGSADTAHKIEGLDAGADDYLGKPFDMAEVEARLRALVRRSVGQENETALAGLSLDRRTMQASVNGVPVELPKRELEVLFELMSPPGHVMSKRILSDKLSNLETALSANALEAFISKLRKRLAGSGVALRSLRGIGYVAEEERPRDARTPVLDASKNP
ncbi:MAG TPA: response regulator transcription factor [Pseudorhodoferax sp.]|nr:response regulator transcription factor [Pseudorhodoferax sp.]